MFILQKRCRLRTAAETVAKHQYANGNQNQGPEAFDLVKRKPVEIIEKNERAEHDENYRADGAVLAPGLKGISGRFAAVLALSRAHAVESMSLERPNTKVANTTM
jgi:hypothetical protein